jgi:hypothetical protein
LRHSRMASDARAILILVGEPLGLRGSLDGIWPRRNLLVYQSAEVRPASIYRKTKQRPGAEAPQDYRRQGWGPVRAGEIRRSAGAFSMARALLPAEERQSIGQECA